jgi:hypothetical protein
MRKLVMLFVSINPETDLSLFPALMHGSFAVLIVLISWFVFRTKLKTIYKAIYLTVPLATVLVTLGIFFYQLPVVLFLIAGLIIISLLYYFYRTKQHWIYYYAVILVSVVLTIFTLLGGEI